MKASAWLAASIGQPPGTPALRQQAQVPCQPEREPDKPVIVQNAQIIVVWMVELLAMVVRELVFSGTAPLPIQGDSSYDCQIMFQNSARPDPLIASPQPGARYPLRRIGHEAARGRAG